MKDISRLKPEEFEALLDWLSNDREKAGMEYLKIRAGLVRYFRFKGCAAAHDLADEAINRVAAKVSTFDREKDDNKSSVFYGFAAKIFLEYLRDEKRRSEKLSEFTSVQKRVAVMDEKEEDEVKMRCLEKCLAELSAADREIFIEYYAPEGEKKSEHRKKIAARMGCAMNALQVKIFRLRGQLAGCMKKCMKNNL
jgi:RNA polymerase sigma factor (sigma-70 family)